MNENTLIPLYSHPVYMYILPDRRATYQLCPIRLIFWQVISTHLEKLAFDQRSVLCSRNQGHIFLWHITGWWLIFSFNQLFGCRSSSISYQHEVTMEKAVPQSTGLGLEFSYIGTNIITSWALQWLALGYADIGLIYFS